MSCCPSSCSAFSAPIGGAPVRNTSCSLFPGPDPARPITVRSLQRACRLAAETAGLDKMVTVHTLRHSFATHLLEQGVDIRVIQDLLGHRHIKSTVGYARVAIDMIRQVQSPLELLNMAATTPE